MFTLWSFYTLLYFVEFCIIFQQFMTVCDYQQFTHVTTEHENRILFCFGLFNCNIIPLFNFVGQHHTGRITYRFINNTGYFQGIYLLCKHTISLTNFTSFFRMQKCEILTCINFPQNNLYSYNIIADSLRKIHISENREKIAVQRLIYQRVN